MLVNFSPVFNFGKLAILIIRYANIFVQYRDAAGSCSQQMIILLFSGWTYEIYSIVTNRTRYSSSLQCSALEVVKLRTTSCKMFRKRMLPQRFTFFSKIIEVWKLRNFLTTRTAFRNTKGEVFDLFFVLRQMLREELITISF